MTQLTKDDLAQMELEYFQNLDHPRLVDVAWKLRNLAVLQLERLEENSSNSSRPPSSDNPYQKEKNKGSSSVQETEQEKSPTEGSEEERAAEEDTPPESSQPKPAKGSAGKQIGAEGFWRSQPLTPEATVPHYPCQCAACGAQLEVPPDRPPYMGYHVLELTRTESGIRIACSLHHYYAAECECGHETKARPGEGYVSSVEGRKKDLKLTEYVLVGPMLATFLAALSNRYRMSRVKIRELLAYWMGTELGVGTIDRCIREAGIACFPVVDELVKELQQAEIVGLDETPWYENGRLKWLWVAISKFTAVFHVGTRKKEELLNLILLGFTGWLVTDGYMGYRDRERRQRCLAHLIRKAIALAGATDKAAAKMGDWLLRELRGLIKTMAEGGEDAKTKCCPVLARLKRACILGAKEEHSKLRALAREILNDWDAVVAFVKNPNLPPTNNDAERALRHAVIARRISFGTRTPEGSRAYAALLSVIETCRLRNQDPWSYIAQTIALARKGSPPLPISYPATA